MQKNFNGYSLLFVCFTLNIPQSRFNKGNAQDTLSLHYANDFSKKFYQYIPFEVDKTFYSLVLKK